MQLEQEEEAKGKRRHRWLSNLFLRIVTFRPTLTFPHLRFRGMCFLFMKYPINWLSFSAEESNGPEKIPISSGAKVGAQDKTNVSNWDKGGNFSKFP